MGKKNLCEHEWFMYEEGDQVCTSERCMTCHDGNWEGRDFGSSESRRSFHFEEV